MNNNNTIHNKMMISIIIATKNPLNRTENPKNYTNLNQGVML